MTAEEHAKEIVEKYLSDLPSEKKKEIQDAIEEALYDYGSMMMDAGR